MVLESPNARNRAGFIYGTIEAQEDNSEVQIETEDQEHTLYASDVGEDEEKRSMYVVEFEEMLKTVIKHEYFLFDESEIKIFDAYEKLTYYAKYLLVRLCLRKHGQWIRKSDLKYHKELGDRIPAAMQELCTATRVCPISQDPAVKIEEREIIDLTVDESTPGVSSAIKIEDMIATLPTSQLSTEPEPDFTPFADDDSKADLRQLLSCLSKNELNGLAKERKIKSAGLTKDDLIKALMQSAIAQTTLPFASKGKGKHVATGLRQTTLDGFTKGSGTKQEERFRALVLRKLEATIKLNEDVVRLFQRVNMVYFRSTQYTPALMTSAILARAKRRSYADYQYSRTSTIWPTRQALLDYEEALRLEAQVDELLTGTNGGGGRSRSRSIASKTPVPPNTSPTKRRKTDGLSPVKKSSTEDDGDFVPVKAITSVEEKESVQNAKAVKNIFDTIHKRWTQLVSEEGKQEARTQGLERFHYGHVLTRIVCKGAYALGVLKMYEEELAVLEELLGQRRWRRGRRGKWYERRALVLTTHIKTHEALSKAYEGVIAALLDDDTHIIYRPKFSRRLASLEKKLKYAENEKHVNHGRLVKADEVYIEGERVYLQHDKLLESQSMLSTLKQLPDSKQRVFVLERSTVALTDSEEAKSKQVQTSPVMTGKSTWTGNGGELVTVEELALQHYNRLGFKGYFCEGRIITTIFGLLCWDIIFAPIDGAFETPYQVAPLDIAEDTFFYSRQDIAKTRLKQLAVADNATIMEMMDEAYTTHEKKMCVGVQWEMFEKEHLKEIAACIGGAGLAVICRMLCEDYSGRTGGVPDLVVWNLGESLCKFVEVKGPGDKLQENQKVWIDALLRAKIPAEVCHVIEMGAANTKTSKASRAQGNAKVGTKRKREKQEEKEEWGEPEGIFVESEDESKSAPTIAFGCRPMGSAEVEEGPPPPSAQIASSPSRQSVPATPRRLRVEVVITTPSPRSSQRRPSVSPEV